MKFPDIHRFTGCGYPDRPRVIGKTFPLLLLVLWFLTPPDLAAQDGEFQFWLNYALKIPVNEKISWGGDTGIRGVGSGLDWYQAHIRPSVSYRLKESADIGGAVAWFGTHNSQRYNIHELRFHQELNARWPNLKNAYFFYRFRVEERFFFYQADIPNAFRVRLRALMGAQSRDLTWFGSDRPIYFLSILEAFKTIADQEAFEVFVNQARFHFAFGHRISKSFHYEIHYIHQGSNLFSSNGIEISQNILRIRLFHQL